MKIAVIYIYPMMKMATYFPLARRFAQTYLQFPAGTPHDLYVICNGATPGPNDLAVFSNIKEAQFRTHNNMGWDIGAFQLAAEAIPCDLMVCLGAPIHFYRAGWLARMEQAFIEHGPGLYGCTAYQGGVTHVRTTSFWFPPELLRSYPYDIGSSQRSRYGFEHGDHSFTRHVLDHGFPCVMVTWKGCYEYGDWHDHAPTHDEILVRDQHIHA